MAQMNGNNTVFTEAFAWLKVFSITQRISIGAEKADRRIDLELVWWNNRVFRILSREPLKFKEIVCGVQVDRERVGRGKTNKLAGKI